MNTKSIIESLLFVNEKPLDLTELSEILDTDKKALEAMLEELVHEYNARSSGICIVKVAGGYQMCSAPTNEPWIKEMYKERGKQKLTIASLETLAIIAYKQPITRMEIESIRGVNIDGVTKHLTDLGLIKIEGRKEVPGRPFLYITTRKFLEYFGLNSLRDLPKLEDFVALAKKENIPFFGAHKTITMPGEAEGVSPKADAVAEADKELHNKNTGLDYLAERNKSEKEVTQ